MKFGDFQQLRTELLSENPRKHFITVAEQLSDPKSPIGPSTSLLFRKTEKIFPSFSLNRVPVNEAI